MKRVTDSDDNNRCRATSGYDGGQCWNERVQDSRFCPAHQRGLRDVHKDMNNYLAEQFSNRIKIEGGEIDEIKVLRENLVNLNAMIASRTALMKDESSMIAHSGAVTDLIMKAEKVTTTLHRLSLASGHLLDRPTLFTLGQQIIQEIADMLENKYDGWEDDLDNFSDALGTIILSARNEEKTK